jgi:hypothetical protein
VASAPDEESGAGVARGKESGTKQRTFIDALLTIYLCSSRKKRNSTNCGRNSRKSANFKNYNDYRKHKQAKRKLKN